MRDLSHGRKFTCTSTCTPFTPNTMTKQPTWGVKVQITAASAGVETNVYGEVTCTLSGPNKPSHPRQLTGLPNAARYSISCL